MAAAVSSMENGESLNSGPGQQQQSHQRRRQSYGASGTRQAAAGRPIRPRLSSSRVASRVSSPFGNGNVFPSAARVVASGSASFSSSAISARSNTGNGGGGLWASIMSLGAAALPASLAPLAASAATSGVGASASSSSSSPRRGTRRDASVVVAGAAGVARNTSSLSPSSSSSLSVRVLSAVERPGGAVVSVRVLPPPVAVAASNARAEAGGTEEGAIMAPVSGSMVGKKMSSAQKRVYLEGGDAVYTCCMCRAHLATRDHIVSECFHGHNGRAFLFERCVNVVAGKPEDRLLRTGMHIVADLSCKSCGAELGWKYEEAADKAQKYKEGKFILERCAVTLEGRSGDGWQGRFGSERCGPSSAVGWGADKAPFAGGDRW